MLITSIALLAFPFQHYNYIYLAWPCLWGGVICRIILYSWMLNEYNFNKKSHCHSMPFHYEFTYIHTVIVMNNANNDVFLQRLWSQCSSHVQWTGFTRLRYGRRLQQLHRGQATLGRYDVMTLWRYDDMTIWRYDDMTIWRYDVTTSRRHDVTTLRRYDVTTLRRYDVATLRRYGIMALRVTTFHCSPIVRLSDCLYHVCVRVCRHNK